MVPEEIAANPQFTLLDEQQVAYQVVLRAVEHARRADAKEAVVITGGPGTGKSVIAVALLGELAKRGYNVSHATGSRAFTTTLQQVVGRRVRRVREVFRYTHVFGDAERNGLDVLIVDEAHRIRAGHHQPVHEGREAVRHPAGRRTGPRGPGAGVPASMSIRASGRMRSGP